MTANIKSLTEILETESECGNERAFSEFLAEKLGRFTNDIEIDRLHNVIAYIGDRSKKKILLTAHMDELSMIVSSINDNGFITVQRVGGIDRRTMLSQEVEINGIHGIICSTPPHLAKPGEGSKVPEYKDLYIDLGLSAEEVKKKVRLGDRVHLLTPVTQLMGGRISSKALDNKLCVYAIIVCLEKLAKLIKHDELDCCIEVLFATQEEVGSRGATVGTFTANPDEAIVLDVTFAKQPDVPDAPELGSGAVVEYSAIFDRTLCRNLEKAAKENHTRYTVNAEAIALGTDADTVSILRSGIKTALISIPIRYMHTPVETADIADAESAADILCGYIRTYEKK